jgi:predicted deacylase
MAASLIEKKYKTISYYKKGVKPILLLMSGTHGNEYKVIKPLINIVYLYSSKLPDFIFIPEVSPSAVKKHTRENDSNNDLNRKFTEQTDDTEARTIMRIVSNYNFKLGISFHEDPELNSFYMYDCAKMDIDILNNFRVHVKQMYGSSTSWTLGSFLTYRPWGLDNLKTDVA